MNGFIYFIGWPGFDKWYIGQRYAENCHPSDLWNNYFTSSPAVLKFSLNNGKPDIIHILESNVPREIIDQREQFYIDKFNAMKNESFFNHPTNIISKNFNTVGLPVKTKTKHSRKVFKTRRTKLSNDQIEDIKSSHLTGRELSEIYKVSTATISKAKNGLLQNRN